jgi:hypothetical protein
MMSWFFWAGLSVWWTQEFAKIAAVHATAWRLGHEDLVKTNLLWKFVKRARTKLSLAFEN